MNKEPVGKEEGDELSDKAREPGIKLKGKPKGRPKLSSKIMIFNTKEK